jgi:hypothetical protein
MARRQEGRQPPPTTGGSRLWQWALVLAVFVVSPTLGAAGQQEQQRRNVRVPGEEFVPFGADARVQINAPLRQDYLTSGVPLGITLPGVSETERARIPAPDPEGPVRIGFGREIPERYRDHAPATGLRWNRTPDGGLATALSVTSPGAQALRIAMAFRRIPDGAEVRFFDWLEPQTVWGPIAREDLAPATSKDRGERGGQRAEPYWSPVMEGDSVGVEIYLPPGTNPEALAFTLEGVSHLERSPRSLSHIGNSQSCEVDLACSAAWVETGKAVAKMIYTSGASSYLCTGQLLNDLDSANSIPYFTTANHCVSTESEANSINFYWFFQRAMCAGANPTSVTQTTGGAYLLESTSVNTDTDFTFLVLKSSPATGVNFAGWSSGAVPNGTTIRGVHHPAGDLKKISVGQVTGKGPWTSQAFNSHFSVQWNSGVTEGGSSGSGIYRGANWPNQYLVGVLTGGASFCSAPTAPDQYGRFGLTYSKISQWLSPSTAPALTSANQVTGSVSAKRWKIYKVVAPAGTTDLDVELEPLSGDPDLYVRQGSVPLEGTYVCRSWSSGTDTCFIGGVGGAGTWYVGVRGWSSATYRLTATLTTEVPPAAPSNFTAAAVSGTQIDLSWTDNANNESAFHLWHRQKNGATWGAWTKQVLAENATSQSVTGLTAGKKYQFKLRATNISGESSWVTAIKTAPVPPAAPSNFAAVALNGTKIDLSWTDNATNETSFDLWRRQKNGGVWSAYTKQTLAANKTSQTITGLTAGTKYHFKLRAANASGTSSWASVLKTTVAPPAAPSGLAAVVASGTKIDLSWTDNSNNETGFDLWRRQKNGGVWSGYTKQTVAANKTSQRVTALTPGKKYQFFLRATNAAGDSAWINAIKTTPP